MAEDQKIAEPRQVKIPLRGAEAAKAALERLQKKGILPIREAPKLSAEMQETTKTGAPEKTESYDPSKKAFPTDARVRAKIVESYPGEETIPPEVKQELTEEARRVNTIAMEASDVKSESPQQPEATTLTPEQEQSRQEGVERFKKILEAQREVEEVKSPPAAPSTAVPEATPAPVAAEAPLSGQEEQEEDNKPEWLRRQVPIIRKGQYQATIGQAGQKPTPSIREQRAQRAVEQLIETKTKAPTPPPPTSEQVATAQSVQQGQEIKKRWYDRIPFLKILRGEKQPTG